MKKDIFQFMLLTIFPFVILLNYSATGRAETEAVSSPLGETELGISAGMWLSGDMDVWTSDWEVTGEKSSSLLLRAIADKYMFKDFSAGLYTNFSQFDVEYNDIEATMFEGGFTLKGRFFLSPIVTVKPGFNLGYRRITADDTDTIDGLGINASFELQYLRQNPPAFYMDLGFLAQPIGGNKDWHLTFGPIFYILGGVAF